MTPDPADCIFCQIAAGHAPSWKVYETETVCAFLDIDPISAYHTLVIPKRHYRNVFDAPEAVLLQVTLAVKHLVDLYQTRLGLEHVQILTNAGAAAQQDVFHLHYHLIPRHPGDGQHIRWRTHPALKASFDDFLARLAG